MRVLWGTSLASVSLVGCGLIADPRLPDGGRDTAEADAGTVDVGPDGGLDAGIDGGLDVGLDGGLDGGLDAGVDVGLDVGLDAGLDAGRDSGTDAGRDAGLDSGIDVGVDVGLDVGLDSGIDAGLDSGIDAGRDSGTDAGRDAGWDSGVDAGRDVGRDVGRDAAQDAGPPPCLFPPRTGCLDQGDVWKPFDGASTLPNRAFGFSVDVSANGQWAIVGAPSESAAYVFQRSDGRWMMERRLALTTVPDEARFGHSVAINDNGAAIVGAPGAQCASAASPSACASIAGYDPTLPGYAVRFVSGAPAIQLSDVGGFGWSVDIANDGTIAVGAPFADGLCSGRSDCGQREDEPGRTGTVHVWNGGFVSTVVTLKARTLGGNDGFGWSLALSANGDVLAAGAPWDDSHADGCVAGRCDCSLVTDRCRTEYATGDNGMVTVYRRSGTGWLYEAMLQADGTNGARSGWAVAMTRDALQVGVLAEGTGEVAVFDRLAPHPPPTRARVSYARALAMNSSEVAIGFRCSVSVWQPGTASVRVDVPDCTDYDGVRAVAVGPDVLLAGVPGNDRPGAGIAPLDITSPLVVDRGVVHVLP